MFSDLYLAAREEGKYRAIGGHKAREGTKFDRVTGRSQCAVCNRPLTYRGDKHAAIRRKRR